MEIRCFEVVLRQAPKLTIVGKPNPNQVQMVRKSNKPEFTYASKVVPMRNSVIIYNDIVWEVLGVGHWVDDEAERRVVLQVMRVGAAEPESGEPPEDDGQLDLIPPSDSDSPEPPAG
jgi:hypothetical protein